MKILITGGAGFIGSHTVDLLISQGHKIVIIDNLSTGLSENVNPRANFYNQDLSNHEKIKEIIEKEQPEVIYHFAAQIDIRKSVEDPVKDAKLNIVNTINLLELASKNKLAHFIFASTGGALYSEEDELPWKEENKEMPISPYGCAKASIEKYLHYYNKTCGLKYTILRYSNVYGPRQNSIKGSGIISIFFSSLFANKRPIINGGLQTRDFVFVKDVAVANMLALRDNKSDIYNISTASEIDIIGVFGKINKFFDNKFEAEFNEKKKGEVSRSSLSYEKIKKSLGWTPITSLDEGLEQTYVWNLKKMNKF